MFQTASRNYAYCLALILIVTNLTSCKVQRTAYFQDVPDSTATKKILQTIPPAQSAVVRPDDVLNITIQTLDPNANSVLNQGNLPVNSGAVTNSNSNNTSTQAIISGYLVNKEGYVHLPYVGDLLVKGLSTDQVKELVTQKISVYFKDPVVNVRFTNF